MAGDTETLRELRAAAGGLVYVSEADAPWEAFAWPAARGPVTMAGVRRFGGHRPRERAACEDVDAFLAPLAAGYDGQTDAEAEDARRYGRLYRVVAGRLAGAKVVRVGRVRVTVYVVGRAAEGGWAGVRAAAVET